MDDIRRLLKIPFLQKWTWVRKRMYFNGNPLLQPPQHLCILRPNAAGHNTHWRPAVDFLQPLKNGTQKSLILRRRPHVVDAQRNHRLHSVLAHPLRRDQFRKIPMRIKRTRVVEISQPIGGAFGDMGLGESRKSQRKEQQ